MSMSPVRQTWSTSAGWPFLAPWRTCPATMPQDPATRSSLSVMRRRRWLECPDPRGMTVCRCIWPSSTTDPRTPPFACLRAARSLKQCGSPGVKNWSEATKGSGEPNCDRGAPAWSWPPIEQLDQLVYLLYLDGWGHSVCLLYLEARGH